MASQNARPTSSTPTCWTAIRGSRPLALITSPMLSAVIVESLRSSSIVTTSVGLAATKEAIDVISSANGSDPIAQIEWHA